MLATTPATDYVSLRNRPHDSSMSPSCHTHHSTPPRLQSDCSYDSPMLTPSPLRRRPLFPKYDVERGHNDADDIFLQSPFKSPPPAFEFYSSYVMKPQPILADDDEGAIFLAPPLAPSSTFFPASTSQPLLTPVKQVHRAPCRSALSINNLNAVPRPPTSATPPAALNPTTRAGAGTKRKCKPLATNFSTPFRQQTLTPLSVASSKHPADSSAGGIVFDRLAPLPAPRFTACTPRTKAETEVHLKRQTATLTRLRITDLNGSREEFGGDDVDSGCEVEEGRSDAMFLRGNAGPKVKSVSLGKALGRELLASKGKGNDEVAEAISPGGHVTKRRARSRPVSEELLESVHRSPSPSASQRNPKRALGNGNGWAVAFPSAPLSHSRTSSRSSSSEAGSPLPRRRVGGVTSNAHLHPPKLPQNHPQPMPKRASLNRLESASSATLFFGPAISTPAASGIRSRTSTASSSAAIPNLFSTRGTGSTIANRHSYAGPGCVPDNLQSWNMMQSRSLSPSPRSSPLSLPQGDTSGRGENFEDEDEDMFFGNGPQDSSFMFSVTEGTPSPRSKKTSRVSLPKKYKPRDSGVVMTDDDEGTTSASASGDYLNVMPSASMSVNSINSDGDDGLVTPGILPGIGSGWPEACVVVSGSDETGEKITGGSLHGECGVDVDAFILRMLSVAAKDPQEMRRVPGTPVKKIKTSYLTSDRPWQSAVANKVGLGFEWEAKKGKPPRKSLPAAFPALRRKGGKSPLDPSTDSEGEMEESPSGRKDKYIGLGLGLPSVPTGKNGLSAMQRTRWLMRRSSSGAFSSGSDTTSVIGTPTRAKGRDWNLPTPRIPVQFSPSSNAFKFSPVRSGSGSSSSSVATLNSPTTQHLPISGRQRYPSSRSSSATRRLPGSATQEQPGRFEREFVEVDQLGSGEFGRVIKARRKNSEEEEVFAIKKSKRFEGVRHRLRLREEVDILQHLSQAAVAWSRAARTRHPNVLAYINSWEEDEALYIQTELCELGNFARFLWEFGRVFPRLDEARIWKIVVDLSNGLQFIHDVGVIHLDLKPANIFVTAEGRFKIGDFGMATLWPRPSQVEAGAVHAAGAFEREGDKVYLAPEILQGSYGKAADVFSFGMTILESASNIVVPDQGQAWHRLRQEDFSQIDLDGSPELLDLIKQMMRTDPSLRIDIHSVCAHPIVSRARAAAERALAAAKRNGSSVFSASPLASVAAGYLEEILDRRIPDDSAMDLSP